MAEVGLTFRKSRSPYFSDALTLAKKLGFNANSDTDPIYDVRIKIDICAPALWRSFWKLYEIVRGWKTTETYVSGIDQDDIDVLNRQFAMVSSCYRMRTAKPKDQQESHCLGMASATDSPTSFGCKQMYTIGRELDRYCGRGNWYEYGHVSEDQNKFEVDRVGIAETILDDARKSACSLCPAFSTQRIRDTVGDLPDMIPLHEGGIFETKYSDIDGVTPIGVSVKYRDPYSITVQMPSELLEMARQRQQKGVRSIPEITYADIAGQDKVLEEVRSVIELPLTHPEYFQSLGVRPQSGIILYGPPGNGKTLICKAVAGEAKAHLEIVSGPELLSKWLGDSENNIRQIFQRAISRAPSIILFDEVDSIAPDRNQDLQHHTVSIVSQLLVCLDGMDSRDRVAVVATTNRMESLDPAIKRPGRFDYFINVPVPNPDGIRDILRCHTAKMSTGPSVDIDTIADQMKTFSGAEVASACREAGLKAIQRGIAQGISNFDLVVTSFDFELALRSYKLKRNEGNQ